MSSSNNFYKSIETIPEEEEESLEDIRQSIQNQLLFLHGLVLQNSNIVDDKTKALLMEQHKKYDKIERKCHMNP